MRPRGDHQRARGLARGRVRRGLRRPARLRLRAPGRGLTRCLAPTSTASTSPLRPVARERDGPRPDRPRRRPQADPRGGHGREGRPRDGPASRWPRSSAPAGRGGVHERRHRGHRGGRVGCRRAGPHEGHRRADGCTTWSPPSSTPRCGPTARRRRDRRPRRRRWAGRRGRGPRRDPSGDGLRARPVGQPRGRDHPTGRRGGRRLPRSGVLVHVDAAQAVGRAPIAFDDLGADLLSLSGHKLGGPPGTGALLVRRGLRLPRCCWAATRSGPAAPGSSRSPPSWAWAPPPTRWRRRWPTRWPATRRRPSASAPRPRLAGVTAYGDPDHRLPHLVCLGVDGVEPQGVLLGLDRAGVAAHSGSACSSESLEPSPVLEAMGVDAHRSLRLSVGWSTTDDDIDRAIAALPVTIDHLRSLAADLGDRAG
ncbi:MAG: aminotransferase class V-fold PLP-dependent enzyme [Acidimicrobiales bacterium]